MEVTIRTNGVKVSEGLREFIDRRLAKLDRLSSRVTNAQLELKEETNRTGVRSSTAQLTLQAGKRILRSEAVDQDVARAIDLAIDKLIRQVRKLSDRQHEHQAAPLSEILDESAEVRLPENLDLDDMSSMAESVSRTKTFQMDPMGVDTAIQQMELIGHDFFFFRNEDDEKFSVLYRRRDGSYGLLSPE